MTSSEDPKVTQGQAQPDPANWPVEGGDPMARPGPRRMTSPGQTNDENPVGIGNWTQWRTQLDNPTDWQPDNNWPSIDGIIIGIDIINVVLLMKLLTDWPNDCGQLWRDPVDPLVVTQPGSPIIIEWPSSWPSQTQLIVNDLSWPSWSQCGPGPMTQWQTMIIIYWQEDSPVKDPARTGRTDWRTDPARRAQLTDPDPVTNPDGPAQTQWLTTVTVTSSNDPDPDPDGPMTQLAQWKKDPASYWWTRTQLLILCYYWQILNPMKGPSYWQTKTKAQLLCDWRTQWRRTRRTEPSWKTRARPSPERWPGR